MKLRPTLLFSARFVTIISSVLACSSPRLGAQQPGEAAYTYLNNDCPDEQSGLGWNRKVQGIAHDHDNWFITESDAIWKIPVTHDLGAPVVDGVAGVKRTLISSFSAPLGNFDHCGDPELITFNGQDFLFVPLVNYSISPAPRAMVVFRSRGGDLSHPTFRTMPPGFQGAWCALDPKGNLYLPDNQTNTGDALTLTKYTCDFRALTSSWPALQFTFQSTVALYDEAGVPVDLDWEWQQGGVISPGGDLLYIVAGSYERSREISDGMHVFKLTTDDVTGVTRGNRIKRSTNGSGRFNYELEPGSYPGPSEEPEGITFWDLDGGTPGMRGQIHVLKVDHGSGEDQVYLKHYTSAIYVDRAWSAFYANPFLSFLESGKFDAPFDTLTEANNLAWDGADLRINAGSYPEALMFSKTMRIVADGGPVTVGR